MLEGGGIRDRRTQRYSNEFFAAVLVHARDKKDSPAARYIPQCVTTFEKIDQVGLEIAFVCKDVCNSVYQHNKTSIRKGFCCFSIFHCRSRGPYKFTLKSN